MLCGFAVLACFARDGSCVTCFAGSVKLATNGMLAGGLSLASGGNILALASATPSIELHPARGALASKHSKTNASRPRLRMAVLRLFTTKSPGAWQRAGIIQNSIHDPLKHIRCL